MCRVLELKPESSRSTRSGGKSNTPEIGHGGIPRARQNHGATVQHKNNPLDKEQHYTHIHIHTHVHSVALLSRCWHMT